MNCIEDNLPRSASVRWDASSFTIREIYSLYILLFICFYIVCGVVCVRKRGGLDVQAKVNIHICNKVYHLIYK